MAKKGEEVPHNNITQRIKSSMYLSIKWDIQNRLTLGPSALIIKARREADCSSGHICPGMIRLVLEGEAETPRPAAPLRGTALTLGLILLKAEVFSIFHCISEQLYSPLGFDAGQIPAYGFPGCWSA